MNGNTVRKNTEISPFEDIFMEKTDFSQLRLKSLSYHESETKSNAEEMNNTFKFDVDPTSFFVNKASNRTTQKAIIHEDIPSSNQRSPKLSFINGNGILSYLLTPLAKRESFGDESSNLKRRRQYSCLKSFKKIKYFWRGTERQSPFPFAKVHSTDSSGFFLLEKGDLVFEEDLGLKNAKTD